MEVKDILAAFLLSAVLPYLGQGHGGHANLENLDRSKFNEDVVRNKEHIKEHYENNAKLDVENMTQNEMEFYFFRDHDTNGDYHLDGLELIQSFHNPVPPDPEKSKDMTVEERMEHVSQSVEKRLQEMVALVDEVMMKEDKDNDGRLNYAEYSMARRNEGH